MKNPLKNLALPLLLSLTLIACSGADSNGTDVTASNTRIDLKNSRVYISHIDEAIEVTHSLTVPNIDTDETEPYESIYDAYNQAQANNKASTINMNALAVYGDIRTDYVRTDAIANLADGDITSSNNVTRLSGAAAKIDFEIGGNIAGINLYINDGSANKTYSATATGNPFHVNNVSIAGAPADSDTTVNLYWNINAKQVFGYFSTYIAYIDWAISKSGTDLTATNTNLIDADYDIAGMMVAGVESKTGELITEGKTIFTGKGRGYHTDNAGDRIGVTFTLNANIDFSNKSIKLASTASKSCSNIAFTGCTTSNSFYNFATKNPIIYDGNNISGAIIGSDADSSYKGIADARFYGDYGDELAGSFAMTDDNNNQYYGVFGSEGEVNLRFIETARGTTIVGLPSLEKTSSSLTGFNDTSRNNTSNNALAVDSIVQLTYKNFTVTNAKISGGVAEFDFDGSGNFKSDGLTLFFDDKKYETTGGTGTADKITDTSATVGGGSTDVPDEFELYKDMTRFGFTPNYLAALYWEVEVGLIYADQYFGYGITGFETDKADIPTAGDATFKGKGQGVYYSVDDDSLLFYFNIIANVDFVDRQAALESTETCDGTLNADNKCDATDYSEHNFSGDASYAAGVNAVEFNNLTTDGNKNSPQMHGTANARFYGGGTDAATEFGGTFSLNNYEAGYIGYFGAK